MTLVLAEAAKSINSATEEEHKIISRVFGRSRNPVINLPENDLGHMITFNDYCRREFGEKLYKISLNAGLTCPNRDGSKGRGGCIFCSEGGSGDFSEKIDMSPGLLDLQIEKAKQRIRGKYRGDRFIAYFQAFTNTYAAPQKLREIFLPVAERKDIAALSVATRPDCLAEDILEVLKEVKSMKPLIVELGLQTIHEETASYINRCYDLSEYDKAMEKLNVMGVHTVTHVILGLPGESREDMVNTVRYVVQKKSAGIKLQLLHVLKGTGLEAAFEAGCFETLSEEEYLDILKACLKELPEDMVVHRLTGDGPKKLLIAPLWSADKKNVMNRVRKIWSEVNEK